MFVFLNIIQLFKTFEIDNGSINKRKNSVNGVSGSFSASNLILYILNRIYVSLSQKRYLIKTFVIKTNIA